MDKKINLTLFFILIVLSFSILAAFYIEFVLEHKPCKLCIYQRIPYFISILLLLNILVLKKYKKISILALAVVSFVGFLLSSYHFGVEQGIFSESFFCEVKNTHENLTKSEILNQFKNKPISCKKVDFYILGLSLASINAIFSFILSVIFIKIYNNYENN
jgi:disulfide bond formation protein DsbB|tara:strand:- start:226 stop:705 length:480 start_codon:yes stop_codon:yes gene_type:complete